MSPSRAGHTRDSWRHPRTCRARDDRGTGRPSSAARSRADIGGGPTRSRPAPVSAQALPRRQSFAAWLTGMIGAALRSMASDPYSTASIPNDEIDALIRDIRLHRDYGSPTYLRRAYESLGIEVLADPFNREVTDRIKGALQAAAPYSVIRLGDGEINLLSVGVYRD